MRPPPTPFSPASAALLAAALLVTIPTTAAATARATQPPAAGDEPGAPAGPQSIERVVEFTVQDEALGVRTALHATNGLTAIDVPELPGAVNVDVTFRSRRDRKAALMFFKLTHSREDDGNGRAAVTTDTSVLVRPGYLQVNRVVRSGDDLRSVVLAQSGDFGKTAAPLADRDDRVTLRVRRLRLARSELVEDITRTAPTFTELLRRHPHDVADHLGPVFRDFKQEAAVLGADARVAWQVLADRLPRDPRLAPRVEALVAQLDAGEYRVREEAAKQLRTLGGAAALVLADLPRGRYSVEQNSRIDAVLSEYRPLSAEDAAERLNDVQFLLGCLAYSDDAAVRAAAAERLGELTGRPLPSPPPDDRERRLKLVRELRDALDSTMPKARPAD